MEWPENLYRHCKQHHTEKQILYLSIAESLSCTTPSSQMFSAIPNSAGQYKNGSQNTNTPRDQQFCFRKYVLNVGKSVQ